MSPATSHPPPLLWTPLIEAALREDLGTAGDVTTNAVIPESATLTAAVVARESGVVAGVGIALSAFSMLDGRVVAEPSVNDGDDISAEATLAVIRGPARSVLTAERVALNLLGRLCGIATATASVVAAIDGAAVVAATRKTTPGLRVVEKYAVACGGGVTHRFGLYDAILIKDNHVAVAGGVRPAIEAARRASGHVTTIEVEVADLLQLSEALETGVDVILLDNMSLDDLRLAVELTAGRAILEASGGITPDNAAAIASTGVDVVSVGWITHSAPALDVALDVRH